MVALTVVNSSLFHVYVVVSDEFYQKQNFSFFGEGSKNWPLHSLKNENTIPYTRSNLSISTHTSGAILDLHYHFSVQNQAPDRAVIKGI